ncbi:MAG: hypothetical protein ABEJ84_08505 [Halodesulfurarchaeum sp.]
MNEKGLEQQAIVGAGEAVGIVFRRHVLEASETIIQAANEAERDPRR